MTIQNRWLKLFGLLCLIVGIAFCAAFGARLSPSVLVSMELTGGRAVLNEQLDSAQRAYEEKRNELGLDPLLSIDGIPTRILERELNKSRERVQFKQQKLNDVLNTVAESPPLTDRIPKLPVELPKDTAKIMQIVTAWRSQAETSLPSYDDQLINQIRNDWLDQKQKMSMLTLLLKRAKKQQGTNPREATLDDIVSDHREDAAETLRHQWIKAEQDHENIMKRIRESELVGPQARLTGWMTQSGFAFLIGLLMIGLGAILTRVANKPKAKASQETGGLHGLATIKSSFEQLTFRTAELLTQAQSIDKPSEKDFTHMKQELDKLRDVFCEPIVETRYELQGYIGLNNFAEIFSAFSAGERNLNRAWTTLVDEHWSECLGALGRAQRSLKRAHERLDQIDS